MILNLVAWILSAITYRIRGGGWINFGSTITARIVWGVGFGISYFLLHDSGIWPPILAAIMAVVSVMIVPHAFCQNMGRWASPQKKWPAFFMPTLSQMTWDKLPMWVRGGYDALEMAGVSIFRAGIVFVPLLIFNLYVDSTISMVAYVRASAIVTVLSPLSYLLSWIMPFFIHKDPEKGFWSWFKAALTAYTTCWGEFMTGAAWGIALTQI